MTLITLVIIESVFWFLQNEKGKAESFLIRLAKKTNSIHIVNYCETDALLGWRIKNFKNYKTENQDIILTNSQKNKDVIDIYISGGSTSDLLYDSLNWPHFLFKKFEEKEIPVKIRIGAVAGYNSGQELLKLISSNTLKPDIHISYSGANEVEHPDYVSLYESEIFQNKAHPKPSFLMPNTIAFIREKTITNSSVSKRGNYAPIEFWNKNMSQMAQLAKGGNYTFFAVLQPVAGYRNILPKKMLDGAKKYIELYPDFYEKATKMTLAGHKQNFIDLSGIFEKEKQSVFKDDCHLKYGIKQQKIANEIFTLCLTNLAKKQ
jgi:hypothetical protein